MPSAHGRHAPFRYYRPFSSSPSSPIAATTPATRGFNEMSSDEFIVSRQRTRPISKDLTLSIWGTCMSGAFAEPHINSSLKASPPAAAARHGLARQRRRYAGFAERQRQRNFAPPPRCSPPYASHLYTAFRRHRMSRFFVYYVTLIYIASQSAQRASWASLYESQRRLRQYHFTSRVLGTIIP